MAFSLPVFLIGVLHTYRAIQEGLAVHIRYCVIGCVEGGVGEECVSLRQSGRGVASDLWGGEEGSEAGECVVQAVLVEVGGEVAEEEVCAYVEGFLFVC